MRRKHIRTLIKFISDKLGGCPIQEQIAIYDALAHTMPTKSERLQAERIAWTLREAAKQQTDFTRQLFSELQWPGHQHDGNGRKGDGKS